MTDRVIVFIGSKRDFQLFLDKNIDDTEDTIPFMELIQHYNARLRPNESGVREDALSKPINVGNCIVRADDYGSVLPHVLANFTMIVTLNHDIGTLFVHNPPRRVIESLRSGYGDEIEYYYSDFIKTIYVGKSYKMLSQIEIDIELTKFTNIGKKFRLSVGERKKPVVLMLYGPSGVGKTESAKSISRSLGGELLRVQFSMMQTEEAYNYVFGSEHHKASFARDMMGRESNVVLIDEFDKVNPVFYNAFYELFDEGKYVDTNYDVDLGQVIFVLTCNFKSENEIRNSLGPAMFSRIGCCIEYGDLTREQKESIVLRWYDEVIGLLEDDEKESIEKTDIKSWFIKNAERYDNIRILKTKMENAIFDKLTQEYIIDKAEKKR